MFTSTIHRTDEFLNDYYSSPLLEYKLHQQMKLRGLNPGITKQETTEHMVAQDIAWALARLLIQKLSNDTIRLCHRLYVAANNGKIDRSDFFIAIDYNTAKMIGPSWLSHIATADMLNAQFVSGSARLVTCDTAHIAMLQRNAIGAHFIKRFKLDGTTTEWQLSFHSTTLTIYTLHNVADDTPLIGCHFLKRGSSQHELLFVNYLPIEPPE